MSLPNFILNALRADINPYAIKYEDLLPGTEVIVDIPIHDDSCVEVLGVISKELWLGSPGCVYSQINLIEQRTGKDVLTLSRGLHAIYPEKVKEILY